MLSREEKIIEDLVDEVLVKLRKLFPSREDVRSIIELAFLKGRNYQSGIDFGEDANTLGIPDAIVKSFEEE